MKKRIITSTTMIILMMGISNLTFSQATSVPDKDFPTEINQFDFWVGDWNYEAKYPVGDKVYLNSGVDNCKKVAKRIVESRMESSQIQNGFFQNSYLIYDIPNKKWRMTVLDPNWGQYNFSGNFIGENAVFYSSEREGDTEYYRITIFNINEDSFNITWAMSKDNKKTWKDGWFISYMRKK